MTVVSCGSMRLQTKVKVQLSCVHCLRVNGSRPDHLQRIAAAHDDTEDDGAASMQITSQAEFSTAQPHSSFQMHKAVSAYPA